MKMRRVAVTVATTLLVMTVSMMQRVEAQGPSCLTVSGAVAPFSDATAVVQQLRVTPGASAPWCSLPGTRQPASARSTASARTAPTWGTTSTTCRRSATC
ncbi:hypothetical protein BDL97_08G153300 [Sphagnum fallax]|nr:hypothetical protein BDL97_08G153300 [Sphagnum fallax]